MPKFQITFPDSTEYSFDLTEDLVTVGRISENMIELQDISVSSHHAELSANGGDYILKDIGSTNGTRLNGRSVAPDEEHPLRDGDTVMFGKVQAVYASENPADASPMPDEEAAVAVAAESSVQPSDFVNASPFQTKGKKKTDSGVGFLVFGIVALLASVGAIATVFMMKAP
ncbi:MAG: Adenylate cyclase [Chthoniobacteraceae bacterium]|nr:Adenylate cyclase [Chthoniobacteraceae bacterium]